jgi:hypothetical protein
MRNIDEYDEFEASDYSDMEEADFADQDAEFYVEPESEVNAPEGINPTLKNNALEEKLATVGTVRGLLECLSSVEDTSNEPYQVVYEPVNYCIDEALIQDMYLDMLMVEPTSLDLSTVLKADHYQKFRFKPKANAKRLGYKYTSQEYKGHHYFIGEAGEAEVYLVLKPFTTDAQSPSYICPNACPSFGAMSRSSAEHVTMAVREAFDVDNRQFKTYLAGQNYNVSRNRDGILYDSYFKKGSIQFDIFQMRPFFEAFAHKLQQLNEQVTYFRCHTMHLLIIEYGQNILFQTEDISQPNHIKNIIRANYHVERVKELQLAVAINHYRMGYTTALDKTTIREIFGRSVATYPLSFANDFCNFQTSRISEAIQNSFCNSANVRMEHLQGYMDVANHYRPNAKDFFMCNNPFSRICEEKNLEVLNNKETKIGKLADSIEQEEGLRRFESQIDGCISKGYCGYRVEAVFSIDTAYYVTTRQTERILQKIETLALEFKGKIYNF